MAVFDLIDNGGEFPVQPLVQANAEDLTDAVGGEAPQADLTAALENLMDWEVALEDEVAGITDCPVWSSGTVQGKTQMPC